MFIGIDPDSVKSGVAHWDGQKIVSLQTLSFFDLMEHLKANKGQIELVVLEAGWLNQSNFHIASAKAGPRKAAAMGLDVGRNQQTGILIAEGCEHMGIPCRLSRPAAKNFWKNSAPLFNQATKWAGKSNPETRDAAMLVFGLKKGLSFRKIQLTNG